MDRLIKFLRLDKWFAKQVELGQKEREKLSGTKVEPIQVAQPNQSIRSEEEVIRQYKNKKREKRRNILVGIIVGFFALYIIGSLSDTDTVSNNPYPVIEEDLTSWVPSGFESWSDDPTVAWRWLEDKEYKCNYDRLCVGIMVVSKNGCERNLYAEVSLLDKNKVQIGYTNDSLGSALRMQKSKLIFNTYEKEADTVRVSEISCY